MMKFHKEKNQVLLLSGDGAQQATLLNKARLD